MSTRRDVNEAYLDLRQWIEDQADHCFPDEIEVQIKNLELIATAALDTER